MLEKLFNCKEWLILLLVISLFILVAVFLPIYDETNNFYNIFFSNYVLKWYDGRSPLNFYLTLNIIKNGSISLPKGYNINGMVTENYYDLIETKNGNYYPYFSFVSNYIFAFIIYLTQISTILDIFKAMIFLNILFYAISLIVFYFIQKNMGLKTKYSLISTFVGGIATSILIYSRYLFINQTLTLTFLVLIYILIKNLGKKSIKTDILVSVVFLFYFILLWYRLIILVFFIVISFFIIKYKFVSSTKHYLLITSFGVILIILSYFIFYSLIGTSYEQRNSPDDFKGEFSLFSVFPKFIPALDYIIYGYHDVSSVWKLTRYFSFAFYSFEQLPGNAMFLHFYGLFGSLFGPKGIIYNSLYLIFSIFGIYLYKEGKKKNIIIISIILIILLYGLIHPLWYGGVTPRYNRFFDIPVLFLTFFSFYYIQEVSKEKDKIKKYLIYLIFSIFVILSVLNVSSLAIRTDWTYEHEANLVSYDLVVWPWYPLKSTENIINLYLTEQGQSLEWKFSGEMENCKSYGNLEGIITPTCGCHFATYAERTINIPWEKVRVNVTACSKDSNAVGKFYFDEVEKKIFIQSNSCEEESILLENSTGKHNLILKPEIYENCTNEIVIWKSIIIEKI